MDAVAVKDAALSQQAAARQVQVVHMERSAAACVAVQGKLSQDSWRHRLAGAAAA